MFNQNTLILLSILIVLFIIVKPKKVNENFHGLRPSKCFSCEKDLIRRKGLDWAWQGQVSKCFDCEIDLVKRLGPKFGALGGNNKTFNNPRIEKKTNYCKPKTKEESEQIA
jgi:hypothetical protein